jgi:rhomboid protease GluP
MANVHGLGDVNRRNTGRNPGGYQPAPDEDMNQIAAFVVRHKVPFLYIPNNTTPPLDESIPETIKITFCPSLKLLSLVNFLALTTIALFITECVMGIDTSVGVLQIQSGILNELGANVPIEVCQGQVYRLLTAAFLHANIGHLLANLVSSYIIITRLEACYSSWQMVIIFLVSAVCGNILSDLGAGSLGQIAVGISTAIYGFIGTLVAYLIVNWSQLAAVGPLRAQLVCVVVLFLFMSIMFSITQSTNVIDYYGHMGGFVGGLFASMLLPAIDPNPPKTMKIVGGVVLGVYLLTTFLVFYLAKCP